MMLLSSVVTIAFEVRCFSTRAVTFPSVGTQPQTFSITRHKLGSKHLRLTKVVFHLHLIAVFHDPVRLPQQLCSLFEPPPFRPLQGVEI
eukprot:768362-Hanusia_phi.AAC.4